MSTVRIEPIRDRRGHRSFVKTPQAEIDAATAAFERLTAKPSPLENGVCTVYTPGWIRNPSDERAADRGCWFDPVLGGYAVWWIERFCRLYEGEWAGEPARMIGCKECGEANGQTGRELASEDRLPTLRGDGQQIPAVFDPGWAIKRAESYLSCVEAGHDLGWQYDFLMRLFGWQNWTERFGGRVARRFREADVWIPKKNAKSPTLAYIGWYLTLGDGEKGQNVYFAARNGAQAKAIVGKHAYFAWEQVEEFELLVRVNRNEQRFDFDATRSMLRPLSGGKSDTSQAAEGINGSVIIDEVHVVDGDFMARIGRSGISRLQPLKIGVSTAGRDAAGYGHGRQDYGRQIEAGTVDDDAYLFICHETPQTVDVQEITEDEAVAYGKACNPMWTITVDEEEFRRDFRQSVASGTQALADFGTYRLNLWQEGAHQWIKAADWAKCRQEYTWESLAGKSCCLGFDLSQVGDLTAAVFCFPEDGSYRVWPYFWVADRVVKQLRDKVKYNDWARAGHIKICEGGNIRPDVVFEDLEPLINHVDCVYFYYDASRATELALKVADLIGPDNVVKVSQGFSGMSEGSQAVEQGISNGTLIHPGNPVLDWQMGHANVLPERFSDRIRPVKPSDDSNEWRTVDGVQAMVMARAGAGAIVPSSKFRFLTG